MSKNKINRARRDFLLVGGRKGMVVGVLQLPKEGNYPKRKPPTQQVTKIHKPQVKAIKELSKATF